jgi:hypothetical protein
MKIDLNSLEILDYLKNELIKYEKNILECLDNYPSLEKLDVSIPKKIGFIFNGEQKGLQFIDTLRSFFHRKQIDDECKLWIINKWGGIGSFKNSESNLQRIKKFETALSKKKLTIDLFSVISSLSKVASFYDNVNYFVYDSRAVYTLNWLILKNDLNNPVFFPMPDSRSKKLTLFDLNTLINMKYQESIQEENWKSNLFLNSGDAYFIYCDLIKELNTKLFPNQKPYHLEMLLFIIADNIIFKELKSSIELKIK